MLMVNPMRIQTWIMIKMMNKITDDVKFVGKMPTV